MTIEEQRLLGGIVARLDNIEERQETIRKENRDDHSKIFGLIGNLTTEGCTLGKRNSEAIKEIKCKPERLAAIGAAIVAIIAAVISWVKQ